jgi:ATP-binding cassette subfamily C (CFTR/MRP) protein 1
MPSGCSLQADNRFGPVIDRECRDGFDFTLLFEQGILGLVPAAAFLLLCPVRLQMLVKRDVRTQPHVMRFAKTVSTFRISTH